MNMIEKIVQAMGESDKLDPNEWGDIYEKRARAALQAMLETSEDMVRTGALYDDETCNTWQSMIRAALEEK